MSSKAGALQSEPIRPDWLYGLDAIKRTMRVGDAWLRSARRSGLKVHYRGGKAFIVGHELIAYVTSSDEEERS